jgi:O-antigen ligase
MLYFIFYSLRIFFDLELRDNLFDTDAKILYYSFLILVVIIPFYSTYSSINYIDLKKVALYSLLLISITMLLSIILDNEIHENDRLSGNLALNPISYGQVGSFGIILSFHFLLNKQKKNILFIFFLFLSIVLGFLTLGRAASRGPFLGIILCCLLYMFSVRKILLVQIILLLSLFTSQDFLIRAVGFISETLQARILASLNDGDSSGRDELYKQGWQQFLDNPFVGNYFVLNPENGKGIYSHNIIIDALMSFGILGGVLITYLLIQSLFFASKLTKDKNLFWVSQILIICITSSMFSSAFYMDALLSIFMAIVFIKVREV